MNNVTRYDCTSGGAQFCQGCYQMERDELGDYVRFEEYEQIASINQDLLEVCELVIGSMAAPDELSREIKLRVGGAIARTRATLSAQRSAP